MTTKDILLEKYRLHFRLTQSSQYREVIDATNRTKLEISDLERQLKSEGEKSDFIENMTHEDLILFSEQYSQTKLSDKIGQIEELIKKHEPEIDSKDYLLYFPAICRINAYNEVLKILKS